jgi:hypothetical protein
MPFPTSEPEQLIWSMTIASADEAISDGAKASKPSLRDIFTSPLMMKNRRSLHGKPNIKYHYSNIIRRSVAVRERRRRPAAETGDVTSRPTDA